MTVTQSVQGVRIRSVIARGRSFSKGVLGVEVLKVNVILPNGFKISLTDYIFSMFIIRVGQMSHYMNRASSMPKSAYICSLTC
jgi:hypothetical protein